MIVGIYKMQIREINIKNRVYKYCFNNLIRTKKSETKNILINKTNYKDLMIYFTRYVHNKLIKMAGLSSVNRKV